MARYYRICLSNRKLFNHAFSLDIYLQSILHSPFMFEPPNECEGEDITFRDIPPSVLTPPAKTDCFVHAGRIHADCAPRPLATSPAMATVAGMKVRSAAEARAAVGFSPDKPATDPSVLKAIRQLCAAKALRLSVSQDSGLLGVLEATNTQTALACIDRLHRSSFDDVEKPLAYIAAALRSAETTQAPDATQLARDQPKKQINHRKPNAAAWRLPLIPTTPPEGVAEDVWCSVQELCKAQGLDWGALEAKVLPALQATSPASTTATLKRLSSGIDWGKVGSPANLISSRIRAESLTPMLNRCEVRSESQMSVPQKSASISRFPTQDIMDAVLGDFGPTDHRWLDIQEESVPPLCIAPPGAAELASEAFLKDDVAAMHSPKQHIQACVRGETTSEHGGAPDLDPPVEAAFAALCKAWHVNRVALRPYLQEQLSAVEPSLALRVRSIHKL